MSRLIHSLIVLVLLGSVACGPTPTPPPPTPVTVQLSWFHTVEFAGFYIAQDKGYYATENLTVTLKAGSAELTAPKEVAESRADFGISGSDGLLLARAQGLALKAISAIFRQNPVVLMSLAEANITKPEDLVGKRIGIFAPTMDNTNDMQLVALLNKVGLDKSQAQLVMIEDYSIGSLTSGKMDVYSGFATEEPSRAQFENVKLNFIYPQDYGIQMYANTIFAREQFLKDNPDVVRRFVRATVRGYQYALEHPDEATTITLQRDASLNADYQRLSMQAEIALIDTGNVPIGTMDEIVWQTTQDILLAQGFIQSAEKLPALYTNEFVPPAN